LCFVVEGWSLWLCLFVLKKKRSNVHQGTEIKCPGTSQPLRPQNLKARTCPAVKVPVSKKPRRKRKEGEVREPPSILYKENPKHTVRFSSKRLATAFPQTASGKKRASDDARRQEMLDAVIEISGLRKGSYGRSRKTLLRNAS